MKKFTRVLCFIILAMLMIAAFSACFTVSAASETYTFDCGLNYSANGNFKLAGYDPVTDKVYDVESLTRKTWDDAFPGYWLKDGSEYLFLKTQSGSKEDGGMGFIDTKGYIDMSPKVGLSAAVVFTAPVDGEYTFEGEFTKLEMWGSSSTYSLSAHHGSTVVDKTTFSCPVSGSQTRALDGIVTLKKGEQLILAANVTSDTATQPEITIMFITVTRNIPEETELPPETSEKVTTTEKVENTTTTEADVTTEEIEEEEDVKLDIVSLIVIAASLVVISVSLTIVVMSKKK